MLLKGQVFCICLFKSFHVCAVAHFDELQNIFFSVNICVCCISIYVLVELMCASVSNHGG